MTPESKMKWCNRYWDEIAIFSDTVPAVGLRIILEANRGDKFVKVTGYTFAEAVDELFTLTLEHVFSDVG